MMNAPDPAHGDTSMARDLAELTLDSIGDAVLSTDAAGNIVYLNTAAEAMTGWLRAAAAGLPLDVVFHIIDGATRERAPNPMALAMARKMTVGLTPNCVLVRRDGHEAEIEDSAAPIRDKDGTVTGAVIVFRDVGAALQTSRQMSHLAQHDELTGLPNRWLLNDRLTEALALARRRATHLAVCFLDVDDFKHLNDSLGHATADEVLRAMAARLGNALRQSDTVSRHGGDEFVVVLSEIEHLGDAALVAKKLLAAVAAPYRIGTRDISVTASLGVALYPDHGHDAHALMANADAAMYDAKQAGAGNYRICTGGEPMERERPQRTRTWRAAGLGSVLSNI